MAYVLERCGLAEDMLDAMGRLLAPIRGGLGYAVIIAGAILGAITGTMAGQVIAMALVSLPLMTRHGYDIRYATGVIAASGTLKQLVPPSLALIVIASELDTPAHDMYFAALVPSILQAIMFCGYTFVLGLIKPSHIPAMHEDAHTLPRWALSKKLLMCLIETAILIFIVFGTYMLGFATLVEAIAIGNIGAIVVAVMHHNELSREARPLFYSAIFGGAVALAANSLGLPRIVFWVAVAVVHAAVILLGLQAGRIFELRNLIRQAYGAAAHVTARVVVVIIGATCFWTVFWGIGGGVWLKTMLTSLPGGAWGFLAFAYILILVVAFFLDFFEIAFIVLPIIATGHHMLEPIVGKDATLIWLGVIVCVGMQASFLHPPFGLALSYLRGVAPPELKTSDIHRGAVPWIGLQLVVLALMTAFPVIVTWHK
jgi:TRAP-type mannitol/chloroaromatic compound transport system permease large subunit